MSFACVHVFQFLMVSVRAPTASARRRSGLAGRPRLPLLVLSSLSYFLLYVFCIGSAELPHLLATYLFPLLRQSIIFPLPKISLDLPIPSASKPYLSYRKKSIFPTHSAITHAPFPALVMLCKTRHFIPLCLPLPIK